MADLQPKSDHHDCAHYCVREPSFCAIINEDRMKEKSHQYTYQYGHYLTSIPPHSKTRNKPRSDARTESTPTTCAQNVVPSSAATRAAAGAQRPKSPGETPQKSMKTRVTTSGTGEMCICAAFSYDACARKRKATYSCLSKSGSQYLRARPHARILQQYLGFCCTFSFRVLSMRLFDVEGRGEKHTYVINEFRASVCNVSALSATSR